MNLFPDRTKEGEKNRHKVLLRMDGKLLICKGDAPPLNAVFRDRTDEYGQ